MVTENGGVFSAIDLTRVNESFLEYPKTIEGTEDDGWLCTKKKWATDDGDVDGPEN